MADVPAAGGARLPPVPVVHKRAFAAGDGCGTDAPPVAAMKRSQLRQLVRLHSAEALAALRDVLNDREAADHARVHAANAVLEWGYGKATRPAAGSDPGPEPVATMLWRDGVC